ncbi:hypothetical protein [Streptomyces sp. NPDC048111]|uniref:hypothetical protein n=1 Tax=Streptomyces sp. NPDC048111 TaxID=3365500 RepID=UPI0037148219
MPGANTSGDQWERFPMAVREALTQRAAARIADVHDGISGSKGPWRPLRPVFLDRDHYAELGIVSQRLMRLVLEACRRRAGTVRELLEVLRVPAEDTPLLRHDEVLGDELLVSARPDIVYSAGVPLFVEFNIDGAIGGTLHADLLARRFHQVYQYQDLDGEGTPVFSAPDSAVDARSAVIRSSLGLPEGARVVIPAFSKGTPPGLENAEAFIAWMGPMCESGRRHGLDTVACAMDDLTTDETGRLTFDGRPVDAVFRLFQGDQPPSPGLDALIRAVRDDRVGMHTSEAAWLLSDKTTLAWLWADAELLDAADRQLVETHVPWTALLSTPGVMDEELLAHAREHRAELVLKPTSGYGGSGVLLGPTVSDAEWEAGLAEAARASHPYIIQRFAEPDLITMDFSHAETGAVERAEVPFVLGPFLFGGRATGVLVRHGVLAGGQVLNANHGAQMSSVVLVDRPC